MESNEVREQPPDNAAGAVSILGHPVTGVLPMGFISAGWILFAVQLLPWARGTLAGIALSGANPSLTSLLPLPPSILLVGLLAAGFLLIGTALGIIWIMSAGGVGPLSDRLLRRGELLAGIVLLATGVLSVAVLARGDPSVPSATEHIARGWLWHEYLRAGTFPRWTDLWFGGFSADKHYPPLSHMLQALIGFLRFSPYDAVKELAWFCRMAGAVGFALFCARIHRDQRSGLFGGILYCLAPTFHAAWMVDGRLPSSLILAILPWGLYSAERLATGIGSFRSGAILGLAVGGLVLSHPGQARLAVALIALFLAVRSIGTATTRGVRAPTVSGILIGWFGGLALAAGTIYPLLREAPLLNDPLPERMFNVHIPDLAAVTHLLRWNATGEGYLGLSVFLLALVGIARALLDRREKGRAIGLVTILLFLLLPWFVIPVSAASLDLIFLGGLVAAAGSVRRGESPARSRFLRQGILPVGLLLILVDLGPISLWTSYSSGPSPRERIYNALQDRLASGRFLELSVDSQGGVHPSLATFAPTRPIASVGGPHLKGAPRAFGFAAAMVDTLARALDARGPVEPDLIRLLAVNNVRYIVLTSPDGSAASFVKDTRGFTVDAELPALSVDSASPVSVLEPGWPPGPVLPRAVIGETGLPENQSRSLARSSLDWIRKAQPRTIPTARAVALPNRLEIDVPDLGPVTLRVARNSYPDTRVLLDGKPWPWREGPLGGMVLDVDAGAHRIEIWATEDRIRRGCRYAQWILAGLLVLVALGPRRR